MAAPTIVTGILTGGSANHTTTSEEVNAVPTDFVSEGVIGALTNTSGVAPSTGAFAVNASGTPDTNINISTGVAYVNATPSSQNSQNLRVKCTVAGTLAISANSSGSTKYDWIYISISASTAANPAVGADNVATIVASRSTSASSDDGTPPTYGFPIAVVTVSNGFSTITNSNIRDARTSAVISATSTGTSQDWYALGYTPSTVVANGNRSYTCTYSNVDLTSFLSAGMRLKHTRLVTAPTQCADLESGSSQYFNRASGSLSAGFASITSTFTAMGWVKLESYGTQHGIISRIDATDGWGLRVNASGQVQADGRTTGAGDIALSYQSIPLNRWVHVACAFTIDSSANTKIYIDGVEVPCAFTNGADGAIGVPAVALEVGALAGTNFLDGKLVQVAIFSTALSAATIRSYMSQGLSGSETNLVAAYSLNGVLTDLAAGANTLTAQGGALATATDSPFAGGSVGTTEYGIITANSFSTNTTLTVQVPEGYAIPTSGGVSAVSYSTQDVPYGFPKDKGKWEVASISISDLSASGSTTNTWYASNLNLAIPVGSFIVEWTGVVGASATSGATQIYGTLSTGSATESHVMNSAYSRLDSVAANRQTLGKKIQGGISVSSQTTYYLNMKVVGTSPSALVLYCSAAGAQIIATPAYV